MRPTPLAKPSRTLSLSYNDQQIVSTFNSQDVCHSALTAYGIECLYNLEGDKVEILDASIMMFLKVVEVRIQIGRLFVRDWK